MARSASAKRPSASKSASAEIMTGGEAIIRSVVENGIDTVFGLPGAQTYAVFDALAKQSNQVRTVSARHEQGTAYMAYGYSKSTGRPSAYCVVPGPGVLNTTAALSTAWGCNAPVLCITGQLASEYIGRRRGALHEIPDQLATLKSLTKDALRIEKGRDAPRQVNDAFRTLVSGRPGPVSIEMALDEMMKTGPVALLPAAKPDPKPVIDETEIEAAADILAKAERPMIFVGSGAQHATKEVLALAEKLDAPVVAFRGGKGVIPADHPLSADMVTGWRLWKETDAAIGIGTRMELPFMRWASMGQILDRPEAPPHVIRIDIDPVEHLRLKVHAPIYADSADGAKALAKAIKSSRKRTKGVRERIAEVREGALADINKVQPHMDYLNIIRDVLPRDGFFVEELCQAGFTSNFGFPVYEPYTYITPGFQGTLGYGYPTSLGVKVANPDKPVVSIIGDGGFMFGVQEMATAVHEKIATVTVLFNNSAYYNVFRDQSNMYGRPLASELTNPDFVKLAKSFGAEAERVKSPEAFKPVLEKAIAADKPYLIEVALKRGNEVSPWPFMHPLRAFTD